MPALNYAAIVVAAIVTFALSAAYYIALAPRGRALGAAWAQRNRPEPSLLVIELAKNAVVVLVVAALVALLGITDWVGALELAFALWIAFPVVLLVGSVSRENVPVALAAIHAGDWLVKLILAAVIVTIWR